MNPDEIELSRAKIGPYKQPQSQAIAKPLRRRPPTQSPNKEPKEVPSRFTFDVPTITYQEVVGMHRQKAILHKLLELPLKKPLQFEQLKIRKSIGILLYGPPGTGKTFLVKAVANNLNVPLCYIKPANVMSKYVGESPKRVEELFFEAKAKQPVILFFDEAEQLLQDRDQISTEGGSQELSAAVSQMLTETSLVHDDPKSCIFMFAATNVPWKIDPANVRSGRFGFTLYIKSPGFWDRRKLFQLYIGKEKSQYPEYFGHINYSLLALGTADYSPVDIEKIAKIALINSLEKDKIKITTRSVQRALWSKEGGVSSLDNFYIRMANKYLVKKKNIIRSMFSKAYRQKELEKGKMDKGDEEIYKDLVKDVERHMAHKLWIRIVRAFGRGIPT